MQIGDRGIEKKKWARPSAQRSSRSATGDVWNRSAGKLEAGHRRRRGPSLHAADWRRTPRRSISILTDAAAIDAVYHGAFRPVAGDVRAKLLSR